jgi:hypothetical protein
VTVTSVVCPPSIEQKKGTRFTCQVQASGGLKGTVSVTQQDDKGARVSYSEKLAGPGQTSEQSGTATLGR